MSLAGSDGNGVQDMGEKSTTSGDDAHGRSIMAEIGISKSKPMTSLPKFQYTAEQLYAFSDIPYARRRPSYLSSAHLKESGAWDPESWATSLQERNASRSGQTATQDECRTKRDRPSDVERETSGKRRSSGAPVDPRDRVKEEQDGIVLSPQRRSFGTGCHVTQQQPVIAAVVNRQPESTADNRDNHRDSSRRIGSGRVHARDRDRDRDREFGYHVYERVDRSGFSRDRHPREKELDRRGSRDKGYQRRIEEEPEWFSGGPKTQFETIELRGFDDNRDDGSTRQFASGDGGVSRKDERRRNWRKQRSPLSASEESISEITDDAKDKDIETKPVSRPSSRCSSHESGRGKGSASSVREKDSSATDGIASSEFDFNDLFNLEAIPGFLPQNETPPDNDSGLVGSRFGQFFQRRESSPMMQNHGSGPTMQDDFHMSIIHGATVDRSGSPTNGSETYFAPISPARVPVSSSSDVSSKRLLEMLTPTGQARKKEVNERTVSVQELEASLKNLLFVDRGKSNHERPNHRGTEPNAFNKLLSQISDGCVTPASSHSLSLGPMDQSKVFKERDILEYGTQFHNKQSAMDSNHLISVLKNAPTEQDILAGLGHSSSSQSAGVIIEQQSAPLHSNYSNNPLAKGLMGQKSFISPPESTQTFQSDNHSALGLPSSARLSENLMLQLGMCGVQMRQQQPAELPPNCVQQQQREILAAILKQQQQQQVGHGPRRQSPITSLIPVIQRPPSPPPQNYLPLINGPLQPPISPNPHVSPHPCVDGSMQNLIQPQRSKIPSPLVFGQTPPIIHHAPSPIHPSQISQSSMTNTVTSLNSNTLQVHAPHVMTRVPSPQELRAHTQQIMQNALIKKKLEEQKEKYKKQQEIQTSRSPNKFEPPVSSAASTSPGRNVGAFAQAFTPTAVMRKMQAGKEKEIHVPMPGNVDARFANRSLHGDDDSSIQMQLQKLGFMNGNQHSLQGAQNVASGIGGGQLPAQGRRIVKSNHHQGMKNTPRLNCQPTFIGNQQSKVFSQTPGNFDAINQLRLQQQVAVAAQCQHGSVSHVPSNMGPSGVPVRTITGQIRPNANVAPAGIHVRNVVPPSTVANSLSQLNQLAARPQQVCGVDPRQLSSTHGHHLAMQHLFLGAGGVIRPRAPTTLASHQMPTNIGVRNDPAMFSNKMSSKSVGDFLKNASMKDTQNISGYQSPVSNLAKWFGSDVLKQTISDLPPVPIQKAQYVDEVEQRQQQTATVHN